MRTIQRAPVIAVAVLFLSACGESGTTASSIERVVQDSAGVRVVTLSGPVLDVEAEGLRLASEPEVGIGVIAGASELQFARPLAGARLPDGRIVVVERNPAEIRIYAPDGSFLRRISGPGEGPGELATPAAFLVTPGDTLLVWDSRFRRLTRFDTEGGVISMRTFSDMGEITNVRHVALGPGGSALLFGLIDPMSDFENRGRIRERWGAVPVSGDGAFGPNRAILPGEEREIVTESAGGNLMSIQIRGRWYWGSGRVHPSARGAWYIDRLRFEALHIDRDDGVDLRIRVDVPETPFTRALIDSLHALEIAPVQDPEVRRLWEADFTEREYPATVPPLAAIFVDDVERVWMGLADLEQRSNAPGAEEFTRRWFVTEDDGTPLGVVELPIRSRPLHASRDGVLLLMHDELGVARVAWYRFEGA